MSIRWGLLAAGNIAKAFTKGVDQTDSGEIMAVASRNAEKAKAFAEEFEIPKSYGSYEELLADPEIDAVYISTPHPMHAEWAIKAADAGKHILCEKPMTMNHADAMTVIEAARRNDVFFMEAFMYRCNPQTAKVVELIKDGAIGDVSLIRASFSFKGGNNPESRLWNPELGGGGILDVGCYAVSFSRLIAGAAMGKDFADPIEVQGMGKLSETGVDAYAIANLKFDNDILAQCATGVGLNQDNKVHIFGSEGNILIDSPWFATGREAGECQIQLNAKGESETITISADRGMYALEADTVAANLDKRQAVSPAMSWDDSLGNSDTLDKWLKAVGVDYPANRPEAYALPLNKEPLKVREGNNMKYGELPGIDKKISKLVMGMDNQQTIAHATAMFDDYFERGGNCFDAGFIYGGGLQEELFGQWVKNRNNREDVVLIDKGGHTPHCFPEKIVEQLNISLDRLGFDYVDIYFMHRDNLDVPVGEFVDILNQLKAEGKIKIFGGSNWSLERVKEANEWAAANGKSGFTAISNNFSLAQMVNPVWNGCIASSKPDFKAYHEESNLALFPWSSQARGFFVPGLAGRDIEVNDEMRRSWYSEENFKRQDRCFELAKKKNVHPVCINLAYVLQQSFPVFPLIGPRKISETHSTCQGLDVELTAEEVKWLNLED